MSAAWGNTGDIFRQRGNGLILRFADPEKLHLQHNFDFGVEVYVPVGGRLRTLLHHYN